MATCKDCIHYYACCAGGGLFNEKDETKEMLCGKFEDKKKYIKLPCNVGDTVYMPWEWNGTNGIASLEVTHIVIDGLHAYIKTNFHTDDEDYYNAYGCGRFAFDDFGKIVFHTIEEAEKAQKGGAEKCR